MKTFARINGGVVVELLETDGDISEMFHPSIMWAECQPDVKLGWQYSAGEFLPPVTPDDQTLGARRAAAIARLPAWEDAQRAVGFEHGGQRWLTTPAAVQDIQGALLAQSVPGGVWFNEAREPVQMTLTDLQELWAAMFARGAVIYQRRMAMEAEIKIMGLSQLDVFEPGWPE